MACKTYKTQSDALPLNRNATPSHLSDPANGSSDVGQGDTRHDRTAVQALLGPYSTTVNEEPLVAEHNNG